MHAASETTQASVIRIMSGKGIKLKRLTTSLTRKFVIDVTMLQNDCYLHKNNN